MRPRTVPILLLSVGAVSGSSVIAREPVPQRRCVLQSRVAAPVVRDDGRLYFRGQPDRKQSYIAMFKGGACASLNPFATAIVQTTGTGYCEGDKVRAVLSPSQTPGPICVIDHLQPFAGDVDDPFPDESQHK